MSTEPLKRRMSVGDWEQRLSQQIRNVELLGELTILPDECTQLGAILAAYLNQFGPAETTRVIGRSYRSALATYLVFQGVFGYKGGEYWTEVSRVTGLPPEYNWRWGRIFEEFLEERSLPTFRDMVLTEGALRYVGPILAHGGIPDYCLPDFFRYVLRPAVTQSTLTGMAASELMDELRWHGSGRYFADKPVLRFLTHGGRVAENFLERCLEMARSYEESGAMPPAEELGLPTRVVAAYVEWLDEHSVIRSYASVRLRLHKPKILLDPWGRGMYLELPAQHLPLSVLGSDVAWGITAGPDIISVPAFSVRWQDRVETYPLEVLVDRPAQAYEVALRQDGRELRSWRFEGPSVGRPIVVFDPFARALLHWSGTLPARRLWLLTPSTYEVRVEGAQGLVETMPRLPGAWSDYEVEDWDLAEATVVTVRKKDDGSSLMVHVRPDEEALRPYLVGQEPLLLSAQDEELPLYTGEPPAVFVPSIPDRPLWEQLQRWRFAVRADGPATPRVESVFALSDLVESLVQGDDGVYLPLSCSKLLGDSPMGSFVVAARGPLGRDALLRFRVLPSLEIVGHDSLSLPDPSDGPVPVSLSLSTEPDIAVQCESDENSCRVRREQSARGDRSTYEISVGPDTTVAKLILVRSDHMGEAARVQLDIPIRRLRWGLMNMHGGLGIVNWTGRVIRQPREAITQTEEPQLVIELPIIGDSTRLRLVLSLHDADGRELQQIVAKGAKGNREVWRFDLGSLSDTIRTTNSPTLRLGLTLAGLLQQPKPLLYWLVELVTDLIVEDINAQSWLADSRRQLQLTWHEEIALRYREIRVWPLFRPWEPPIKQLIPDDCSGSFLIQASADDLPPGRYRIEFATVDPWAPAACRRPRRGAQNTTDIDLGTKSEGVDYLSCLPEDALGFLECSLATENPEKRRTALQRLAEVFDQQAVPPCLDCLCTLQRADIADETGVGTELAEMLKDLAAKWGAHLAVASESVGDLLRKLLLDHVGALLDEVAARAGSLDQSEQADMRRLLVEMGLINLPLWHKIGQASSEPATVEALWQFWPPLGLMLDSRGFAEGESGPCRRVELQLAIQRPSSSRHFADQISSLCGTAPEAALVGADVDRLKEMARKLRLVPLGLLDPVAWHESNFAWLITILSSVTLETRAKRWVNDIIGPVRADLGLLGNSGVLKPELIHCLSLRYAREAMPPLRNLPFVVGAIALIQRALSHLPELSKVLKHPQTYWSEAGAQALDLAPQLYTRDLCLFELALVQGSAGGQQMTAAN